MAKGPLSKVQGDIVPLAAIPGSLSPFDVHDRIPVDYDHTKIAHPKEEKDERIQRVSATLLEASVSK
jgi:hypothetical protein